MSAPTRHRLEVHAQKSENHEIYLFKSNVGGHTSIIHFPQVHNSHGNMLNENTLHKSILPWEIASQRFPVYFHLEISFWYAQKLLNSHLNKERLKTSHAAELIKADEQTLPKNEKQAENGILQDGVNR